VFGIVSVSTLLHHDQKQAENHKYFPSGAETQVIVLAVLLLELPNRKGVYSQGRKVHCNTIHLEYVL